MNPRFTSLPAAPPPAARVAPPYMVFLYYDNPNMLLMQMDCWSAYAGVLARPPRILIIDDGSPKTSAADIVRKQARKLPIQVYRIKEDIPWNFTGARNLGCHRAEGWIYMSDIDTLLPAEDAKTLFESQPLDPGCFYMPRRVWLPTGVVAEQALVNLLFHKDKYLAIGGYDEDYAGNYGREESDFYRRLKRVAKEIPRDDVTIKVVPPKVVADARTWGRKRDKTHNAKLFEQKEAAGFPNPVNPLRFTWERAL
jgi:hypothetical protein